MADLKAPPVKEPALDGSLFSLVWAAWLGQVWKSISGPVQLSEYTVAKVPRASENRSTIIFLSDEAGGATVAFSDGQNWRRCQDRNIIS